METGFKIVEVPGQQCRKVAEKKQQGYGTAKLKKYETPARALTTRFFSKITGVTCSSSRDFASLGLIFSTFAGAYFLNSADPFTGSSSHFELQKTAPFDLSSLTCIAGESNIDISNDANMDLPNQEAAPDRRTIKSKKQ